MTLHRFVPSYATAATFDGHAEAALLLAEQGMFAASEDFVRTHGGPLAQRLMDAIPEDYRSQATAAGLELNVDLRVHQLEAGDFPASPGWHCDSPYREVAFDAHAQTQAVQRNLVATISTCPDGVSNTEFLNDVIAIESDAPDGSSDLWKVVNEHIESGSGWATSQTTDGAWTEFDCVTLHRAAAASRPGVRMFARVSLWMPPEGHQPGLTLTEQVYRQVRSR